MAVFSILQKQSTRVIILAILVVILLGIIVYNMFNVENKEFERVLTCPECGRQIAVALPDGKIGNQVCDKCRISLGYAWKCSDCDYEFSFTPKRNPYDPRKEKR